MDVGMWNVYASPLPLLPPPPPVSLSQEKGRRALLLRSHCTPRRRPSFDPLWIVSCGGGRGGEVNK